MAHGQKALKIAEAPTSLAVRLEQEAGRDHPASLAGDPHMARKEWDRQSLIMDGIRALLKGGAHDEYRATCTDSMGNKHYLKRTRNLKVYLEGSRGTALGMSYLHPDVTPEVIDAMVDARTLGQFQAVLDGIFRGRPAPERPVATRAPD